MLDNVSKYVYEVYRCKSVSAAAKKLYISAPGLVKSMDKLEEEFGVRLFARMRTGVSLTPAGHALARYAQMYIRQHEFIFSEVKKAGSMREARVEVCMTWGLLSFFPKDFLSRFIVSNPAVTVVIPGMADSAEVKQNISACADTSPLRADETEKIEGIKSLLGTNFCRRCNYCAPCSVGINISAVFLFEGYYSRYGLQDWAKDRYSSLAKSASDCIGCGVCEERCPYHLPIRQMLKKAAEVMGK